MYKDLRKKEIIKPIIEIEVKKVTNSCGGCPTIFDFEDKEGTPYHFRLRNGHARIVCEETDESLLSESMHGFDGVCGWNDVEIWARENGVILN